MKQQIEHRVSVYPTSDNVNVKVSSDYIFHIDIDDDLTDDRMRKTEFEDKVCSLVRSFKSLGYRCSWSVVYTYFLDV